MKERTSHKLSKYIYCNSSERWLILIINSDEQFNTALRSPGWLGNSVPDCTSIKVSTEDSDTT